MRRWVGRWWRVLLPGMVILGVLLVWSAGRGLLSSQRDETWARCQREGVIRVGMDASYPPFELEEKGEFRGYDVDLASEIGRRLGLRVVFVNVSFDGLYDALLAKRCDVLISALPYDAQRTRDVAYTGGYFNAGQVIVTRREDRRIQDYSDLANRRVAVEMGSQSHQEVRALRARQRIPLTIEQAPSSAEALSLLQKGQVDAAVADAVTARTELRTRPDLQMRGAPLTDESYVIATRRDSPQLYAAVNGALNALRQENWLEQAASRWL